MQLKDVMRRELEVVGPDTSLQEAARKMTGHDIPVLPVCEGSQVVGLLTMHDIAVRATAQGCDPLRGRVREVMMTPPIYGREDQDVNAAADLMQRWRISGLPVLDDQMHLVGIVSLQGLHGGASRSRRTRRGARGGQKRNSRARR
jgi:CBS domain-containing protein